MQINHTNRSTSNVPQLRSFVANPPVSFNVTISKNSSVKTAEEDEFEELQSNEADSTSQRAPGVSGDETWKQLQATIAAEKAAHRCFQESVVSQERDVQDIKASEEASSEVICKPEESTVHPDHRPNEER